MSPDRLAAVLGKPSVAARRAILLFQEGFHSTRWNFFSPMEDGDVESTWRETWFTMVRVTL